MTSDGSSGGNEKRAPSPGSRSLRARERLVLGWLLVVAVGVAVFLACRHEDEPPNTRAPDPRVEKVQVPPIWQDARTFGGHAVHVGQKQLPCESCHTLQDGAFDRPPPARCANCHTAQATLVHAPRSAEERHGPGVQAECTTCHAFLPDPERPQEPAPSAWACQRCHEGDSTGPTLAVHGAVACQSCHQPHALPNVRAKNCEGCHQAVPRNHGETPATTDCRTCHTAVHERTRAALECAPCHTTASPTIGAQALFASGHQSCVDCHRPHSFDRGAAATCQSCHQDVRPLGTAAAHTACGNCHAAHDVRSATSESCRNCHATLRHDHPKGASGAPLAAGGSNDCLGCHAAHPKGGLGPHATAAACSSCHPVGPSSAVPPGGAAGEPDAAFHGGHAACTDCHVPHQFRLSTGEHSTCTRCHAAEVAALVHTTEGHATCATCHRDSPHAATQPARPCADCHAEERGQAHPGHAECSACHEPHATVVLTACASCHAQQLATAPAGHTQCRACHDAHSGEPTPTARCQSCHADQSRGPHSNLVDGCQTCHRAHGPSGVATPPACNGCHAPNQLPALHRVPEHQDCARCHSGHQLSLGPERPSCLACHQAQTQHFPEATRCTGCHSFQRW